MAASGQTQTPASVPQPRRGGVSGEPAKPLLLPSAARICRALPARPALKHLSLSEICLNPDFLRRPVSDRTPGPDSEAELSGGPARDRPDSEADLSGGPLTGPAGIAARVKDALQRVQALASDIQDRNNRVPLQLVALCLATLLPAAEKMELGEGGGLDSFQADHRWWMFESALLFPLIAYEMRLYEEDASTLLQYFLLGLDLKDQWPQHPGPCSELSREVREEFDRMVRDVLPAVCSEAKSLVRASQSAWAMTRPHLFGFLAGASTPQVGLP